ncbi:hypothetical protein ACWKW6_22215 [Dyadobacter jiangsuensis]
MKNLLMYLALIFTSLLMLNCWDQHSNEPLTLEIGGIWHWTKTMDRYYDLLESSSPTKTAHINVKSLAELPYGSEFFEILEFYVDSVKVDSLFMPSTDNYNSSSEKGNQVIVHYLDGNRKPVTARFKFFFPRKKSAASRMELTIQRNTKVFNPDADTLLIREYFRDVM